MTSQPMDLTAAVAAELTYQRGGKRSVTNKLLAEAAKISERQVIRILQGEVPATTRQLDQFAEVLDTDSWSIIDKAYARMPAREPVK